MVGVPQTIRGGRRDSVFLGGGNGKAGGWWVYDFIDWEKGGCNA